MVGVALAKQKATGLDGMLRGMFRALQNRPVPDRIRSVVDQLDEGEAASPRTANKKGG